MQERTDKDIKASNDSILKTVNEFCKAVDECKCGKEVSAVFQLCPYSSEIYGSSDKCNCCESCRHECAMDI